jgi:hypothetical protein
MMTFPGKTLTIIILLFFYLLFYFSVGLRYLETYQCLEPIKDQGVYQGDTKLNSIKILG